MNASQSRKHSLFEAFSNVLIGYGIAFITQLAVFPLFGIHISLHDNLAIGGIFTVISIARSYLLRRFWNWIHVKQQEI